MSARHTGKPVENRKACEGGGGGGAHNGNMLILQSSTLIN